MTQVLEGFIGSITSDGALDFNGLLLVVLGYLGALWLAFALWVFVDAKRRYQNILIAIGITVAVFILNFPALILYLIVRPEDEWHHHASAPEYSGREYLHGGVEVPVIKFVDRNGDIKLSLNLKVNSNWDPNSDMNVEVAWDSDREDITVEQTKVSSSPNMNTNQQEKVVIVKDKVTSTPQTAPALSSRLGDLRKRAAKSIKSLRSKPTSTAPTKPEAAKPEVESHADIK